MLNIGQIEEGFVLDHIKAGKSLSIYHHLQLDKKDCTVAIIKSSCVDEFIETVGKAYEDKFGHKASFYVTDTGDGAKEI